MVALIPKKRRKRKRKRKRREISLENLKCKKRIIHGLNLNWISKRWEHVAVPPFLASKAQLDDKKETLR
jgi:hypothetical protein